MLLAFILIIISTLSPSHSFIPGVSFQQILPIVAFLFFFGTDSTDSPDCLPIGLLLSISVYYFLVFLYFHFLVVSFVR